MDDSLGDVVQPIIHLLAIYDEDLFRAARLIRDTITLPDAISKYLKADLTTFISPYLCAVMERQVRVNCAIIVRVFALAVSSSQRVIVELALVLCMIKVRMAGH